MEAPDDPGSPRRQELLAATVAYAAEHGISDLALRPLATAIGSSPRVLLYLFGSKDGLVREILAASRAEQFAVLTEATAATDDPREALDRLWTWLIDPVRRDVLRLFFEAYSRALAGAGPWADFARRSLDEWLGPLASLTGRLAPEGSSDVTASLTLAVMRGLMLDLLASGDIDRVTRAWEGYVDGFLPPRGIQPF